MVYLNIKTNLKKLFTAQELKEFGWSGNEEATILHECTIQEILGDDWKNDIL